VKGEERKKKAGSPSTRTHRNRKPFFRDSDAGAFLDEFAETNVLYLARWQTTNRNNGNHHFECIQGYHRLSRSTILGYTHRPWCVSTIAVAVPGRTSLTFGRLVRVHGKRRLWWQVCCYMTNAGLVPPRVGLFSICVNTSDNGCTTPAFTRFGCHRLRWCYVSWCS
jgi:hypothetical protein